MLIIPFTSCSNNTATNYPSTIAITKTVPITLNQTLSPTQKVTSQYLAYISANVTIAEKEMCNTAVAVPPSSSDSVYWILEISVKNSNYSQPVQADYQQMFKGWVITSNNKIYYPELCGSIKDTGINLKMDETSKFIMHFIMPRTMVIGSAQICYQGQQPYSYGTLSGGALVSAYDWANKKVISSTSVAPTPLVEKYYIFGVMGDRNLSLKTIKSWDGTGNNVLEFSVTQPSVINYSYTATSSITSNFDWGLQGGNSGNYAKLGSTFWDRTMSPERQSGNYTFGSIELGDVGTFKLKITAIGCHWYIKLGTE